MISGLILGAALVAGQQKAPTSGGPDPAKVPVIEELFRITQPEKMMQQMLAQAKAAFSSAAQNGFSAEVKKMGDDPAKYQADLQKMENQIFGILTSRLDWNTMKPQFVKLYSDTFTKDELTGLVSFYKSPAGQAQITKMPTLMGKLNTISQQQMQTAGPEIQKVTVDFMNSIRQKSQASHPAAPAKPQ